MTPESIARLSALFDEVADLPSPARQARLETLAGDDLALLPRLHRMLAARGMPVTADLLARGPAFAASPEPTGNAEGDAVGPWRLVRRIGEGGMGEVWLAERGDGQLRRQVALKLPTLGLRRQLLVQRFARERDILASLEHPHIARLYDAGVAADGQPWLALEYVQGEPIDAWCRAHQPTVAERLRLLLQVADAVAFAHRRLVLHRDLKPGNILVTVDGQVRLLDFGIAKLMEGEGAEATELTQVGGRALTPRYASPEQLRGDRLTTASDVYSFAVVAYELLAGQSPYGDAARTPAMLEALIAEDGIPPASARCDDPVQRAELRGDLDAILAHAMRARPGDRYPGVDALAADLQRHLQGEQVHARPAHWADRLRRLALRQRLPLALAGTALAVLALAKGLGAATLVTLALAAGLAGALWQARRARDQAQRARTEAHTAGAVKAFLLDVFRATSADQADPVRARQRTALELLADGARRIEHELDDAPQAKLELLDTLAEMYADLGGDSEGRLRLREAAVRTAERSFGPRSEALVRALARLAMACADDGRLHQARPLLERAESAISLQRRVDPALRLALDIAWSEHYRFARDPAGLPFAERAATLALRQPPSNDWLNALALRGVMQRLAGRLDDSLHSFQRAADLASRVPGGAASVLAAVHQEATTSALALGDAVRAEHHLRAALEIDLRTAGPESAYVVMDFRELALFLAGQGRDEEARSTFADAHAHARDSAYPSDRLATERALLGQEAWTIRLLGDPAHALELTAQALALEPDAAHVPTTSTLIRFVRCDALLDLGRTDEAAAAWAEASAMRSRYELASPPWRLNDLRRELRVRTAQGAASEAAERGRVAWNDPELRAVSDGDAVVEFLLAVGHAQAASGDGAAAAATVELAGRRIDTPPRPRMRVPLQRAVQALRDTLR